MFGPATSATKDIIKRSTISYLTGTDTSNTQRVLSYSTVPRAIKNYTGDAATTVAVDATKTAKLIEVESVSGLTAKSYIAINDEQIFIKSITGNKLTVLRAQDKTTATEHLRGAEVHVINAADNALIAEGDDFGFSGTITSII